MDTLELAQVAQGYYESLRKKNLPAGWEKYVATDGKQCMFVRSEYVPPIGSGQAVFYLTTRNFHTSCQLYKVAQ